MNERAVRRAVTEDADAICAIYNAALSERSSTFETNPRSAADFEARIEDSRFPLLVSDGDGGAIGWAALASYSTRPCYAGIGECSVYVAAPARGRGVGTALTEALAVAAEQRGFHKMIGKLFTDNSPVSASSSVAASRQLACIYATGSSMAPGATSWLWSGYSPPLPRPLDNRRTHPARASESRLAGSFRAGARGAGGGHR